ncbi:unnamed protein product [Porites lobata]|uniref:Uncharacterized protein n=1 Tax=Porites lobata TaxID=104759 RepID=A0ABN8RJB5_9CNID|nr:unnamed protein product [Porites lobata]
MAPRLYLNEGRDKKLDVFRTFDGNYLVDNILAQHNGTYSSTNKLKCTILAPRYYFSNGACFIRELAKQLAKFKQVQVSVLVPEDTFYNEYEERKAKEIGVTIVKAKKQPGFFDSIEWLNYPPADLKTDIVIGVGEQLGKVAQNWKMQYQCKSIQFACGNDWERVYYDTGNGYLEGATVRHIKRFRGLSLSADIPVAVGPKTADKLTASLRSKGKQVFSFTPGIISQFSSLTHATKDGTNFRVLFVGGSNPDNFQEDGLELAAKTMAELNDKSYHLICVGAGKETQQQCANFFHQSGVPKRQFEMRNLPQTDEEWKDLFGEVISPSCHQVMRSLVGTHFLPYLLGFLCSSTRSQDLERLSRLSNLAKLPLWILMIPKSGLQESRKSKKQTGRPGLSKLHCCVLSTMRSTAGQNSVELWLQ